MQNRMFRATRSQKTASARLAFYQQNFLEDCASLDDETFAETIVGLIELLRWIEEECTDWGDQRVVGQAAAKISADTSEKNIAFLSRAKALNAQYASEVLMRCMRVTNRTTHDTTSLESFRTICAVLGITIAGDIAKCIAAANFAGTYCLDSTIFVEI